MWTVIAVLLPLATLHLSSAASLNTLLSSRHKRDSDSRVDLDALRDSLDSLADNGLPESVSKRGCALGLNSHHCAIAALDDLMRSSDYLKSGFSPGKRGDLRPAGNGDLKSRADMLLHSLDEQMKAVATLRGLLSRHEDEVKQQQKRTCAFRLGNHCLTEALDRAASTYYYLRSPHSPGRRRRHASLIKTLQSLRQQKEAESSGEEGSVAEVRQKRQAESGDALSSALAAAADGQAAAAKRLRRHADDSDDAPVESSRRRR